MALHAFVAPIMPGKTDEWRRWIAELNGPRKQEFDESRQRFGLHERTFLQTTPQGDFVIVTLEGDNPLDSFKQMVGSNDPFLQWFFQRVNEIHGMDIRQVIAGPLPEMVIDSDDSGMRRMAA
jgi:hypothetical protein